MFCSTSWTTNPALQGYLAVHSHGTGVFYLQPHFSIFLDICYILYKTLSTLREEAIFFACVCLCARWLQWGPTLCKPMDCSLSGSSVHGILQARILELIAVLSSYLFCLPFCYFAKYHNIMAIELLEIKV